MICQIINLLRKHLAFNTSHVVGLDIGCHEAIIHVKDKFNVSHCSLGQENMTQL